MAQSLRAIRQRSRAKQRLTRAGCLRELLTGAKSKAKKAGVLFNLTIRDLDTPGFCPVLGIELDWGGGGTRDNAPSLDRLVPALGYVKENVRVISYRANRIKNDSSPEEIVRVAIYLCESINEQQSLLSIDRL
jgi:hypothetical protein